MGMYHPSLPREKNVNFYVRAVNGCNGRSPRFATMYIRQYLESLGYMSEWDDQSREYLQPDHWVGAPMHPGRYMPRCTVEGAMKTERPIVGTSPFSFATANSLKHRVPHEYDGAHLPLLPVRAVNHCTLDLRLENLLVGRHEQPQLEKIRMRLDGNAVQVVEAWNVFHHHAPQNQWFMVLNADGEITNRFSVNRYGPVMAKQLALEASLRQKQPKEPRLWRWMKHSRAEYDLLELLCR